MHLRHADEILLMEIIMIVLTTKSNREIALEQLSLIFACTFLEFCALLLILFFLVFLYRCYYKLIHTNPLTISSSELLDKLKNFLNKITWPHFILASQHNISLFGLLQRVPCCKSDHWKKRKETSHRPITTEHNI